MADVKAIWAEVLPQVRDGVTGVGVWTALNKSVPITVEGTTFVLGIPHESSDLTGHLKLQQTRVLIERLMSQKIGETLTLRVVEGTEVSDWELMKRRDAEAKRLQEQALNRQRAEMQSRSSWESVYDQISRKFASTQNKSLPQNRAKFFLDCVDILAEEMLNIPINDDMGERNFARCIERVSQYSEVPSVIVALRVLEKFGA